MATTTTTPNSPLAVGSPDALHTASGTEEDNNEEGSCIYPPGGSETSYSSDYAGSDDDDDDDDDDYDDDEKRLKDPKEIRVIAVLRLAVLSVMLVSGLLVSVSLYFYSSRENHIGEAGRRHDQMRAVTRQFTNRLARIVEELDQLSVELAVMSSSPPSSSTHPAGGGSSWPYVVFPDYERFAGKARRSGNLDAVAFLPLVQATSKDEEEDGDVEAAWTEYASAHLRDWLDSSLSIQEGRRDNNETADNNNGGGNDEFEPGLDDGFHRISTSKGSILPLWQLSPAVTRASIYGSNLLQPTPAADNNSIARLLEQVLASKKAVVGESIRATPWDNNNRQQQQGDDDYGDGDSSPLPFFGTVAYPILLDDRDAPTTNHEQGRLVGVLLATVSWQSLLDDVLADQLVGLDEAETVPDTFLYILENTASQNTSFVSSGGDTTTIATTDSTSQEGAAITKSYVIAETEAILEQSRSSVVGLDPDFVGYRLRVSLVATTATTATAVETTSVDTDAVVYSVVTGLVFLLLILLFVVYDCVVQRRQRAILNTAILSSKLISSLFPTQVRQRLLHPMMSTKGGGPASDAGDRGEDSESPALGVSPDEMGEKDGMEAGTAREPHKRRLRNLLTDTPTHDSIGSKPIADFFPNCTVLFSDICGFTAWSSERSPTEVFTLLQAVYQAFDKIARKRGVFKVETIGDSYVAVTGLPEPQEDHAVIMAGFALQCRAKLKDVTRKLEVSLGPETSDLTMRFGLHSGPVTAGVLQGDRARFQLFGDTVNTAARMESNGQRERIQLSSTTAELLAKAGKGHWINPREDKVEAKGKGEMQTYWLENRDTFTQQASTEIDSSCRGDFQEDLCCDDSTIAPEDMGSMEEPEDEALESTDPPTRGMHKQGGEVWATSEVFDTMPPPLKRSRSSDQVARLIDWNVSILQSALKQVIAQRQMNQRSQSSGAVASSFTAPKLTGSAIDEVTEIIALDRPAVIASEPADLLSIYVDEDAVAQLRDYISNIAIMYRDNPFHNYEHACHVQLGMVKLLKRIVSPEVGVSYGITSDPLTQFACIFSALIHDVDHTGVPNTQLIKENAPVATHYKHQSVAEQNSIDLAWELLMEEDYYDLRHAIFTTEAEFKRFRQTCVNSVMATDIMDKELGAARKERWNKAFSESAAEEASVKECPIDSIDRRATVVIEHLIQASDVSHTMQHWEVYRKWNERLFFEMYTAFQTGRTDMDPSVNWYKGEIGFFDFYIIPLAKKLKDCGVFGVSSDECLNYAMENRRQWVDKGQQIVQEMLATDYFARLKEAKKGRRSRRNMRKVASVAEY